MFYPRLVRYSSADPSVPTMLPPQARVPSTPSMLLSFKVKFALYLSCEKNENKQRGPVWLIFKNNFISTP